MMEFEHRGKDDGEFKERAVMVGLYNSVRRAIHHALDQGRFQGRP
jgi:hypothetical protein